MFSIDNRSHISIYEQVVNGIKDLIISGVLSDNEKLPSVRELSKMLSVNPNTVQKSFNELEKEGFVYKIPGKGTFVTEQDSIKVDPEKVEETINELTLILRDLIYYGYSTKKIRNLLEKILLEISKPNNDEKDATTKAETNKTT